MIAKPVSLHLPLAVARAVGYNASPLDDEAITASMLSLFSPLTLGRIRLLNWIGLTALPSGYTAPDGFVDSALAAYYLERGAGWGYLSSNTPARYRRRTAEFQILARMPNWIGEQFIVGVRLNVEEFAPGGIALQYARVIAKRLISAGGEAA
jgi:2,4-dienoyl-CoA reductase-like NADH-dependent reductase (Old Yellow Enzyme family)